MEKIRYSTPLTKQTIERHKELTPLSDQIVMSAIHAPEQDFSYLETLVVAKKLPDTYVVDGIRVLFKHSACQLTFLKADGSIMPSWRLEHDKELSRDFPGQIFWGLAAFNDVQQALRDTSEDYHDRHFTLFEDRQCYARIPLQYLLLDWDIIPNMSQEARHEFSRSFTEDSHQAFRQFMWKAMPGAPIVQDIYSFDSEVFNWAVEPDDSTIRQRRIDALKKIHFVNTLLFTNADYPWSSIWSDGKRHVAIPEIAQGVDEGNDVFCILGDKHELPPSFMRSVVPTLKNTFVDLYPKPQNYIRMIGYLAWLQLPKHPQYNDLILSESEQQEWMACQDILEMITDLPAVHQGQPCVGSRYERADSYPVWTVGGALMAAAIVTELFRPQFDEYGQISNPSWRLADKRRRKVIDKLNNFTKSFKECSDSMAKELFLPTILTNMQRILPHVLSAEDYTLADQISYECLGEMLKQTNSGELLRFREIEKIDTMIKGFSAYEAEYDASLLNDPLFLRLGYKLSDDDTQQAIFEHYRDHVLDKRWRHCQTIHEFLIDAGLLRHVSMRSLRSRPDMQANIR